MEDAGLGYYEDQPALIGRDLAERGEDCIFCKNNKLREVSFYVKFLHALLLTYSSFEPFYPTNLGVYSRRSRLLSRLVLRTAQRRRAKLR